jgi:predicted CXXCH cytochrome family protein
MTHIFEDIHLDKGLSCADCHGGDPEAYDDEDAAMWDADDFVGAVDKEDEPAFCGKCHSNPEFMRQYTANLKTDQMDQYWTSHHGEKLKEGNENVAVCTDCHGVHGIYPVDDPRSSVYPLNVPETCNHCHGDEEIMEGSGFPTDQYEKFASSVHGQALLDRKDVGAPACNDCHGNHGAQPPSVYSIADICGTCHVNNTELFKNSHLKDIFLKEGINQCEGCHNYHEIEKPSDESLKWADNEACSSCHEDTDAARIMGNTFYHILDSLNKQIELAKARVADAENLGMEVSDLYFDLKMPTRY